MYHFRTSLQRTISEPLVLSRIKINPLKSMWSDSRQAGKVVSKAYSSSGKPRYDAFLLPQTGQADLLTVVVLGSSSLVQQ